MGILGEWESVFFTERKTQIFLAESLAPWIALREASKFVAGRDLVLFIDNTAAMSALVCGSPRAPNAALLAHIQHLLWCRLGVRVWVEWFDSDSNPSDGLSHDGVTMFGQ